MVCTRLMNEKTPSETVIKKINNNNNNNNNKGTSEDETKTVSHFCFIDKIISSNRFHALYRKVFMTREFFFVNFNHIIS